MFGHYHANTLAAGLSWADLTRLLFLKERSKLRRSHSKINFVCGTIDSNNGEEKEQQNFRCQA